LPVNSTEGKTGDVIIEFTDGFITGQTLELNLNFIRNAEVIDPTNPEVEIPIVIVNTVFPGANPMDVEELVTQIIEDKLSEQEGIMGSYFHPFPVTEPIK